MKPFNNYFYKYAVIGLAIFSILFVFIYFLFPFPVFNTDLTAFLTGAEIIRSTSKHQLYDSGTQQFFQSKLLAPYFIHRLSPITYRYLPLFALIYIPLTIFNYPAAYFINLFLMLLFVIIIILIARKHFNYPLIWLIPFAYTPTVYSLLDSQPSVIIALSFFLLYHFLNQNRPFLSGLSTALLLIKPHYFLASLPFLFLARLPKKFLLGTLLGLFLTLTLSALLVGIPSLLRYPGFVLFTESLQFSALSTHLINLPGTQTLILLPLLLILIAIFRPSFSSILISLPFFLCVFSGHTYSYDLTILLLPLFFLLRYRTNFALLLISLISLGFAFIPHLLAWPILLAGIYFLFGKFAL